MACPPTSSSNCCPAEDWPTVTVLDTICWRATGAGPAVVVPRLNVDWTQVDLAALEARFTVVVVSPRGFGPSERPGGYSGAGFLADVARVLDHLGVVEYAAGEQARRRHAAARADAAAWAEVTTTYDPAAAVAFWDDVASLPRAALVDLACPIRCWWGAEDLVLGSLADPAELAADFAERGIPYDVLPGLDHEAALDRLDLVLPRIADWLVAQLADHADGY